MHTQDSPITKKEACSILKISYNPARLDKIIEEYNDRVEYRSRRRLQNRGKPARPDEISDAVRAYVMGTPISNIAASLYRSIPFIRNIIETIGVPTRGTNEEERSNIYYLPEQCVSDKFEVGELVWSATKHQIGTILDEDTKMDYQQKYGSKCYTVFVHEGSEEFQHLGAGYYASELAYDLGSLKHLHEYGVDLGRI
jgi:hypothetical protein